jgi:uncharacterized protein (DUF1697 family)
MNKYAALLRGIMPTNPNMRNEKLRNVFETLGFSHVQTVISSGNVLFESKSKNTAELENKIEKALFENLGFRSATFIRSRKDLEDLIKKDPFEGREHSKSSYLLVTFLKKKPFLIFNNVNLASPRTPDIMRNIDKDHGKENTTRTWKTVERIVKKMSSDTLS